MQVRNVAIAALLALPITLPASAEDLGIRSADPSVIKTDKGYVAVEARDGRSLLVRVAPEIEALAEAQPKRIWFDRERLGEVWAPEILFEDGVYTVYFAAGVGSEHRMYAISSPSPQADYGAAQKIVLPEDKWAIDGVAFRYAEASYFVWSGWQGDTDVQQDLFISRLDETGAATGPRVRIGSPDQTWENIARETPAINEGPQPIIDPDGRLHVVYSANGSWGANYCLADLRLTADGDPLDPSAWHESDGCLFGGNRETLAATGTLAQDAKGVGHHSFVLDAQESGEVSVTDGPQAFLYHGVPADQEPANFWAARKWFEGQYEWVPDVAYGSGEGADRGWSLRFSE